MANKKKFINPLTRSSEEELNISPRPEESALSTTPQQVSPLTKQFQPVRKRGNQAFEKTHQRFTGWIDKNLKQKFEKLALEEGVSKTSLLNEALADLLIKYRQK